MTSGGAERRHDAGEVDEHLKALLGDRDRVLRRIERRAAIVVRSWMVANERSWLSVDVSGNLAVAGGWAETNAGLAAAVPLLPRRVFGGGLNNRGDFTLRLSDLDAYLDGAGHGVDGEEPWKTVVISFVEESHHEVRVNVPRDFQPERCDLANELASLDDDGCEFVERSVLRVLDADEQDRDAEYFAPPAVW
ncbi:hypothetical protein [Mycobacterium avium]|uniref:hypothetical protein n=1 Tax=Mycobacterium avium TaxID=1764 RepID=UPI0020D01498|nr:hypothetical protein [Mycobacterium avium]